MRLVEFLSQILEAHAETLRRLAALLGEERLLEVLEEAGEMAENAPAAEASDPGRIIDLHASKLLDPAAGHGGSPYQELEGTVREMSLPAMLEFHLWAYPHYRAFIESAIDLEARIPGPGGDTGSALVEEAVAQAQAWVRALPLEPSIGIQAEQAAHVPWLRFRTHVLKRIGRRPMGPVY